MHTVLVYIFVVASISYKIDAQQYFSNQFQIAGKPSPNEYVRLSDIPFQNAVRAVSTPQRDYVPIHESQQDIPPPPRPQQAQNQIYNNINQHQIYPNSIPVPVTYNNQFPVQQVSNIPLSFQYMTSNEYPNQVYNLLYHSAAKNNRQTQGNNGYVGSSALNNIQIQGTNRYLQGNNYLQTYSPSVIPGYAPTNNNLGSVLLQNNNKVPTNNFQSSVGLNGFRPSYNPFAQNNVIDLRKIVLNSPNRRYTVAKSQALALPSNNNVQYASYAPTMNNLNQRSPLFSTRSPRMIYTSNIEGYRQNSVHDERYKM